MIPAQIRSRGLFVLVGVLLVAVALVVVSVFGSSANRHVRQNETLFESLPVFPGAQLISLDSHAYYLNESRIASGYSTLATFRAPAGTLPEQVLDFMAANIGPEWQVARQSTACLNFQDGSACAPMISLRAVNGTAFVSVDPANLGPDGNGSLDVYVDHDSHLASEP